MIGYRIRGIYSSVLLMQMGAATALFWAYGLSLEILLPNFNLAGYQRYAVYNFVVLAGFMIHAFRKGADRDGMPSLSAIASLKITADQILYVMVCLVGLVVLIKDQALSRLFLLTYLPLLYVQVLVLNRWLPRRLCRILFTGQRAQRILLIGEKVYANSLISWLEDIRPFGFQVVGLISDETTSLQGTPFKVLGGSDDIERVIREERVDTLVVPGIPQHKNLRHYLVELSEKRGLRLMVINDLEESFGHSLAYFHHDGMDFISFRNEPLEDPFNRVLKRMLDILVSLPVVVILLPLLAVGVKIVQARQAPGPLFYRQQRSGFRGRSFDILKFRTMYHGHGRDEIQASKEDGRIYPFGRFLRKSSLDEIPQFWNVLMGEMSVVGPRPHMPEHDAVFAKVMGSYRVRNYIRPGITGLAQVKGYRGETIDEDDVIQRARQDIEYIENWSMMLDLMLIVKTGVQVFFPPKKAY